MIYYEVSMKGCRESKPGVIFFDDTMTMDRIEYKYKYRTTVWKEDVRKLAAAYEARISALESALAAKANSK